MKKEEKEEVKKIVDEAMEENRQELKKEKKSIKKIIIISSIIGGLLLIAAIAFLIMYLLKPRYKVTLKDGGGVITKEVVIEDNIVKEMPEITPPEGKKLVFWINKKKEVVRPNIPLPGDDSWEPFWGDPEAEYVTIRFKSGTPEKLPDLKIPKGSGLYLPYKPNNYKDWKFLYWVDKNEYVVLVGQKVDKDMDIHAYWWKPGSGGTSKETCTISYDTGTKEKFDSLNLIKGGKYVFMTPSESNGDKVFRGWLDDKGNLLTSDSKVERDMTLKANWKDPYTCPQDCTPSADGKTCTKKTTVDPTKEEVCPGTEYNNGYKTYCVDASNFTDEDCARQCASGENFGNKEIEYQVPSRYLAQWGTYSDVCCAKIIDRVEKNTCPEGYDRDGEKCTKTETINCTAN
ncbi:MAG: hypothetical protein J5970_03550 [Bacilli bacterium]|nr:hypothetical protein [Bacilli bacterium]